MNRVMALTVAKLFPCFSGPRVRSTYVYFSISISLARDNVCSGGIASSSPLGVMLLSVSNHCACHLAQIDNAAWHLREWD